jgi:hypothetical protein
MGDKWVSRITARTSATDVTAGAPGVRSCEMWCIGGPVHKYNGAAKEARLLGNWLPRASSSSAVMPRKPTVVIACASSASDK